VSPGAGWIKIHRRIQEHKLWTSKEPFCRRAAWIDLCMLASRNEHQTLVKNKSYKLNRGDLIVSTRFLQKRWRWGVSKTLGFLAVLETNSMMVKIQSGNRNGIPIIYSIVKYDTYQSSDLDGQSKSQSKVRAKSEQSQSKVAQKSLIEHENPRPKNGKNGKKGKKYSFSASQPKKNISALRRTFSDLHIGESRKSSEPEEEFDEEAAQKSLEKELEETEARLRSKPNLTKKERQWLELRARKKKQGT
jgi:hypothetical protein